MHRHSTTPRQSDAARLAVAAFAAIALIAAAILLPATASLADTTNTTASAATTSAPTTAGVKLDTIDLGTAGSFSVMASTALTAAGGSNAGAVGSSSSSTSLQAQQDLTTAYNAVAALTPTALIDGDLGGRVITPGIYKAGAALAMSTSVTFDALGDPNAIFVFQVGAALNTTAASAMILTNGAQASHIFWQVLGAVTTGAASSFVGTILGNAAITAGDGTSIDGRALTMGGAVTLSNAVLLPVPDIAITSAATPTVDVEAGDAVSFTNVIRNRGNVDLTLALNAGLPTTAATTIAWPDNTHILAAGQTVTATTTYEATLTDAAARAITANATVVGTPLKTGTVSASSSVTLNVYPTPVADSVNTSEGAAVTFNAELNDAGSEANATFSRVALPATTPTRLIGGAPGVTPTSPLNGSVTCDNSGTCTYQPAGDFTGIDTFDYALAQGTRTWVVRVTATVTPTLAVPTPRAVRVVATAGGAAVSFHPSENGSGTSSTGSGTVRIASASTLPAAQGSLACTATTCVYTPSASFTGVASATYTEVAETSAVDVSRSGVAQTSATSATSTPATITIFVDPPAMAATGFVASTSMATTATVGTWTNTTAVTASAATCAAGRPSTTISWLASSRATSWVVERQSAGTTGWITVATLGGNTLSFSDGELGEGNTYVWRVRPDAGLWQGVFSSSSNAVTEVLAISPFGC
jgi:hypothetical protein